jgi:type I restriction-modification system DNA methylase subunit
MKKITKENAELKELLLKKKEITGRATQIEEDFKKIQDNYEEEIKGIINEINEIDVKAKPLANTIWKDEIQKDKYEQCQKVYIDDDENLAFDILDPEEIMQEYKQRVDEEIKKEQEKKEEETK